MLNVNGSIYINKYFYSLIGILKEANKQNSLAVTILPCRFKNRVSLIKKYMALAEYSKAFLVAEETVDFPEKIPSK